LVDLASQPQCAFGILQQLQSLDASWRTFPRHYLLYASAGTFRLEVASAEWLPPPQRAAWIRAGVPVRISIGARVTCCSDLFAIDRIEPPAADCQVFAMSPLAREMIRYAMRWGPEHDADDQAAERFFLALASVCLELAATPDQFWLPRARSSELSRAIQQTLDRLAERPSFGQIARAAGVSERTLARRFAEETHMTWRQFLRRARLIRAMELLAKGSTNVTETVYATGFERPSAFVSAFRDFTGETPSQYRKRFAQA